MPATRLPPPRVATRNIIVHLYCQHCKKSWSASAPSWNMDQATGQEHPCVTAGHRVVRLVRA